MIGLDHARRALPLTLLYIPLACTPGEGSSTTSEGSSDSGGTTSSNTSGPSPTTTVVGTTGSADTTGGSTDEGTTAADSTDSTGSTGTAGGSTDEGTTAGIEPFDVPFLVLDPIAVPLTVRVQPGFVVFTSEAEWTAATDAPVPPDVDFATQWVVYGSHGPLPLPGHEIEVSALTWDAGELLVDGLANAPDVDCETFTFTWPADTLLAIDALEVEVSGAVDQTVPTPVSCAGGAGDSQMCTLDVPCGPGLLCSTLIRTLVLSNDPNGLCQPSGQVGTFTGPGVDIPADGSSAEATLVAMGLASVDTDVVVWVEVDHPAPEELLIQLRNSSDNTVTVANLQPAPLNPGGVGIVPIGFSGDESVNGPWALVVQDTVVNGNNGSVISWELEIMSRFD